MAKIKIIPKDQLEAIQNSWAIVNGLIVWSRNTARGKKLGDPVGFSSRKSGHKNIFLWHNGKLYGYVYARIVWFLHHGVMPDGEIDHVNCNPIDDRVENLRVVTREQNLWNTKKSRIGGLKRGYYQDKRTGKYHVQVQCNGKVHGIYGLDTEEYARIARGKLASQLHGQYAR